MKESLFTIKENTPLTKDVYRMRLAGDVSAITAPGQFINIKLEGLFLRRPISVYDCDGEAVTNIYKVVGKGTEQLCMMVTGETLNVLTGLGNGYDTSLSGDHPLLLGGGVGVPPLYLLAKKLIAEGKQVSVVLGFNTKDEVFCEQEFKDVGCQVTVTTVDGSYGVKGFVTDALPAGAYACACGPEPMLRAVHKSARDGQFSFEARMGCGFGACMGCTMKTAGGPRRVCKEGPVFGHHEIIWEER